MKELSIEEKAKRYDEAIEYAHYLINKRCKEGTDGSFHRADLEKMFHELKESEDEKIRKYLLKLCDGWIISGVAEGFETATIKIDDVIAWLEKQSTPQVRTGIEWVNTIDDACDKRYSEEYAHGEYCHEQSFKWGFQEGVDWLEKQGEKESDQRYKYLKELLTADDIYQMAMNDAMVQEAKTKAIDALSKLEIGNLLEIKKQGEQKPVNETPYPEPLEKAIDLYYYSYGNGEGGFEHLSLEKFRDIVHTFVSDYGQKPAWSEEDEKKFSDTLAILRGGENCYYNSPTLIDWLKSLKDRYTWKPSEGQLECLGYAIEKAEKDWSPLANNRIYLTLKALKEQLEKL